MSKATKIIIVGVLGAAAILYYKNSTDTAEPDQMTQQELQPVKNEPTLMSKRDRTGITVDRFARANLIHHFGRNKDEYWCTIIGSPEEYILKNMEPVFEENTPSESDRKSNVDFEVLVSVQSQSYRVKKVTMTLVSIPDGGQREKKESEWSEWQRGTPYSLRRDLFKIQRMNGKYLWVVKTKVTPM